MFYTSTRNKSVHLTSSESILKGISDDGGLLVPDMLPKISLDDIGKMKYVSYAERTKSILNYFLNDFTDTEISNCVDAAYSTEKFTSSDIAPTVHIDKSKNILELWHGPTCAFKDMALQLLPHLMTTAAEKSADGQEIIILVATSGDTGKAALDGFKNVKNTKIFVFYPENGVSATQKKQMVTQEGENVFVSGVSGNFDDCQSTVKSIFTNNEIKRQLKEHNKMFSSANSINWGRLVPQIVYYFSAYCDLININEIQLGDEVNFTVPTGNFGNILAAFYAKKMGLPIKKLICASNTNNVLTDFINTGTYDINRKFFTTTSPSMDILISSNLERLLFSLSNDDEEYIKSLMHGLSSEGKYTVNEDLLDKIKENFVGGWASEKNVTDTIRKHFENYGYLMDTHTAAAVSVYDDYVLQSSDDTPTIIDSTASPYKFSKSVLSAISNEYYSDYNLEEQLFEKSKVPIPTPISSLKYKKVRFDNVCTKDSIRDYIYKNLDI